VANILFLVGSLRRDSLNARLARVAAAHLPEDYEATFFDFANVTFGNEDRRGELLPELVAQLRSAISNADGEAMRRNWDVFAESRK
jgi:NAD(P)H-dependent FMN reductase